MPVVVNLVSADEAAAAAPDFEVTEEVLVLKAAQARDEAMRLADAGDFDAARRIVLTTQQQLRLAGMHTEADALDADILAQDTYSPAARKRLSYDANQRRRRRKYTSAAS